MSIRITIEGATEEQIARLNIALAFAMLGITEEDLRRSEEQRAAEELRAKIEKEQTEADYKARWHKAYLKYRQIEQDMWEGKNDCYPGAMIGCDGFVFTLREKPQN